MTIYDFVLELQDIYEWTSSWQEKINIIANVFRYWFNKYFQMASTLEIYNVNEWKTSYKQLMFQKDVSFFFILFDKDGYLHFISIKLMNMDMDVYRFDSYCIIICHFQVTRWYFLIHKVQKDKINFRLWIFFLTYHKQVSQ